MACCCSPVDQLGRSVQTGWPQAVRDHEWVGSNVVPYRHEHHDLDGL